MCTPERDATLQERSVSILGIGEAGERLVETETATPGERVVIASQFWDRPFFQKYTQKIGEQG
jgi:hypothetical protein